MNSTFTPCDILHFIPTSTIYPKWTIRSKISCYSDPVSKDRSTPQPSISGIREGTRTEAEGKETQASPPITDPTPLPTKLEEGNNFPTP